jgi:hypothetical protein
MHAMMYMGSRRILHSFLASVLDGREWLASRTRHFTPGKSPSGIHLIWDQVVPGDSLDFF